MALSPSASSALKLAAVWIGLAGVGAVGMMNAGALRDMLGPGLEYRQDAPPQASPSGPAFASSDHAARNTASAPPASIGRMVELRAGPYGHFYSRIRVNGRSVEAMVDTGASIVALTYEDARSAGIHIRDSDYSHRVSTANGVARVALVTLDSVSLEDIMVYDVRAAVAEPGKLAKSLLGMSFLGQLRRAEMSRGVLLLEE
jgi:aspartyl protease family protein